MKTMKTIFTVAAILIAAGVWATEAPKWSIEPVKSKSILVSFESATASQLEIVITDQSGVILHQWQSESRVDRARQLFNLSNLGQGKYNVAINDGVNIINREICIRRKDIEVGKAVQLNEPYFNFKEGRLKVSYLNTTQKNVFLNIYKNGEHYTGFNLGKELDIQKCFDFSMAEKGNYEIVLTDNYMEHNYVVTK